MNIIRTPAVELSTIPAIVYKTKLKSGGAGLKILRLDTDTTAVFTMDRRTGEANAYGKVDSDLFPEEAVSEALELTDGLPYSARGKIKISTFEVPAEEEDVTEDLPEDVDMVDSDEYKAIVNRYTDEKGKLNYKLMNKDFIQFASKSTTVEKMIGERALEEDILVFIIKSRSSFLSGKKESLNDAQAKQLIETLDEIDPRGAFKELKVYIRRMLARG